MKYISVLIKPASGACNMACSYCFYADEIKNRENAYYGMMSYDTLSNVVRKTILAADKGVSFAFQGGEPTLRGLDFFRELIRLQKKYNRRNKEIHNALQTNGYAIDEEWCEFLHDNNFLVGLSIDGTEELHDKYRKDRASNGTFERVCHTAELFDRYQVEYNILTVVNADVAKHAGEIYEKYRSRGWHYLQFIPCLAPLDDTTHSTPFAVTAEAYGQFLCDLFACYYKDAKQGKIPYIRQFDNYIGILLGYAPEACDMHGICSIQHVVEADGSVFPCDFYMLDEYCLGNLNTDTIADLQRKRSEIGFVERSYNLTDDCRRCRYFALCRGGCQRHRNPVPGSSLYENYFCESYKMFFDRCLRPLQELAQGIGMP